MREAGVHVPVPQALLLGHGRRDLRPGAAAPLRVPEPPGRGSVAGPAAGPSRDKVWLWKGKEMFCNPLK